MKLACELLQLSVGIDGGTVRTRDDAWGWTLILAVALAAILAAPAPRTYSVVRPGVTLITTPWGSGSGFLIGTDARQGSWFVTNRHVVGASGIVHVLTVDARGPRLVRAREIVLDEAADLAFLRVNDSAWTATRPLRVRAAPAQVDEEIFAVGFPYGEADSIRQVPEVTFTKGTVTRRVGGYIESSVRVNPGSSGGPAVAADGTVVGVVTAKYLRDNTSLLTPVEVLRSFADRAGFSLALATSVPVTAPASRATPDEHDAPGVVSVTIDGRNILGAMLHPASVPAISYVLLPFSGLTVMEQGAEVELVISSGERSVTRTGRFVSWSTDEGLSLVELARCDDIPGASLGPFEQPVGGTVLARLFLQRITRTDDLGLASSMISRIEREQNGPGQRIRLDVEAAKYGLVQGIALDRGKVVGVASGSQESRGTVELQDARSIELLHPHVRQSQILLKRRDRGRCQLEVKGTLVDPQGLAETIELRLSPPGLTATAFNRVELVGPTSTEPIRGPSFTLKSGEERCDALGRRAAQLVLRGARHSYTSMVFAVPWPGLTTVIPMESLARSPVPPAPLSSPRHALAPGGTHEASTPAGILSFVQSPPALFLDTLPLDVAVCSSASFVASRWPNLAFRCGDDVVTVDGVLGRDGLQYLAIDGQGDALAALPWGSLAIRRGHDVRELTPPQRYLPEQVRLVRALPRGFLLAQEGPRPGILLWKAAWNTPQVLEGTIARLPGPTEVLTDSGQISRASEADLALQDVRLSAGTGNLIDHRVASQLLEHGPSCKRSQRPLPTDAHFSAHGAILSVGQELRAFFHARIGGPQARVDERGRPVVGSEVILHADGYRQIAGTCRPAISGPTQPLEEAAPGELAAAASPTGALLYHHPPRLESRGALVSLPFREVLAARWVKDRFLVVARASPETLSLWHVGDRILQEVGRYPPLASTGAPDWQGDQLALDVTGQLHVARWVFPQTESRQHFLSARVGERMWRKRPLPNGVQSPVRAIGWEPPR